MGTRGPRSGQQLAVVAPFTAPPPEPPADLTPAQADIWRNIVERMPAGWFPRETHAVLAQLCRHVDAARHIALLVEQAERDGEFMVDHFVKLLGAQRAESGVIRSLSTALRLTNQSRRDPKTAGREARKSREPKPWEPSR